MIEVCQLPKPSLRHGLYKTSRRNTVMSKPKRYTFYRKKRFIVPVSILLICIIVLAIAFKVSPWPSAILIRISYDRGGRQQLKSLQPFTPQTALTVFSNQSYKQDDKVALLDVYIPTAAIKSNKRLPVVIWTHGGGWIANDKTDAAPYYKLLAAQGFVVVSLNYSLAPNKTYPTQLYELNAAYSYITTNAARYHVNKNKIVLAGDSSGAQLASQMAALITNPAYARQLGLKPSLEASQVAGVVLFCGIYNLQSYLPANDAPRTVDNWLSNTSIWSYTGQRHPSNALLQTMSPQDHITSAFPATFISGGNGDGLTGAQSVPFANKLQSLGVNTTTLFYPQTYQPSLPHEYQFNLTNAASKTALQEVEQFLAAKTG
jgi:acetyl esterase